MLQGSFFPKAILSSLFFCLLQIGLPAQNPRPRTPLSLEQALHLIRDTYQVQVAYDPEAVEGLFTSAPLPNGTLVAALDAVLRNTGLSYRLLKPDQVLIRAVIPLQTPNIPILSGVVRDKHTGEPLPFASVFHPKSRTGTVSNAQGLFSIALDNTTDSSYLDISYLGYTHQQVALQQFQTSGELTVLMEPQVLEFIPVVVTDRLPIVSAIPSEHAVRINPATFGALPTLAGINDPMRKLQLLPGVMASNDISAGLKIRGANASENMVLLDGIPLIQVDHFLGIFSAVNGAIVDQIDLYKNAFPVEYGGRTAGLIDIRTQNPQTSKLTGGVQLNNLSADAWLLAPLGSKSGLSLAGRTTFDNAANSGLFDYVNPSKILEEELPNNFRSVFSADPSFRFHDANAKWSWSPDSSLYAEANYFQSKDNYTYAFEKTFINFLDRKPIRNTELFDEESQWRNSGYSFQLKKDWSDRLTSKLVLSGSDFNSDNRVESKVFRQGIALIDTLQTGFASTQEVLTRDVNWKNDWQWRPGHELSFGYQFTGYQVSSDFTQGSTNYFSKAQKAGLHTGFAQWQADYPGGWLLSAALRSTWYSPTQKMYFSPRINLSRKIEERLVVKGFTGLDYQFLQEATHENQFGRTASFWMLGGEAPFPVARSSQWMAGFSIPGNTLKFDLEFYQNHTVGIVEYALGKPGLAAQASGAELISRFRFFEGSRQTRGLDLLLEKSSGALTGLLSYTLSKTIHTFPDINFGDPFPAQDDRRHQLQLASNYRRNNWNFGFTYVFASGRPYLDLARIDAPITDRRDVRFEDRQNYLPDYHRMDLGINYRIPFGKNKLELGVNVFNVLNNRNVGYVQYLYLLDGAREAGKPPKTGIFGTETNLLSRTVSASLQWKF